MDGSDRTKDPAKRGTQARVGTIVGVKRATAIARIMGAQGIDASLESPPRVDFAPELWEMELFVDASQLERATKVLAQFGNGTLIEATATKRRCGTCGYSLAALGETGTCPECGAGFFVIGEPEDPRGVWRCPQCGEVNPWNFDACWNCPPDSDLESPPSRTITASPDDPVARASWRRRAVRTIVATGTSIVLLSLVLFSLTPSVEQAAAFVSSLVLLAIVLGVVALIRRARA